ncbi:cation:dicarboxylase symporter family transporter [Chitinophaga oryziterrae]|uniref:Cation:dicarboxylase symporter family transporter n=1 Tax=Chitinophaga oryziterrae TaxID=1031224 RepID=A0A6N8JJ69_9BACT|nr:dicarboxylate/amino acid:cation symporter [Chitinophaga oryziterrae]MVT44416.1 cation:dicarboxylase symporter family transporter [Chitinophaga oryziterrae]
MRTLFKNYSGILLLLGGITTGSILGLIFGKSIEVIKPIGDIFLNILFTAIIPLVFFSIASAIANVDPGQKLGKILSVMGAVFLGTVLISSFLTIVTIRIFPLQAVTTDAANFIADTNTGNFGDQVTKLLTTGEFFELLSRKNMLPFIIFSTLIGFATLKAGNTGEPFRRFLMSGNEVMKHLLILIMYLAPIGLGAYFAYQVGTLGPQLFGTYASSMAVYYGFGIFYFIVMFSVYAFVAGGVKGIKTYWKYNVIPTFTALGSCSSIATIPANLDAAAKMGVPDHINSVVVPLGATLHKDGSSISSVVKIGVVFAMFGRDFSGIDTILLAMGITVLVSIVEGGIPNGGYIGELLVISVYGFPVAALPAVMIIGTLVDPLATILNATGDTVAAMLVTKFTGARLKDPAALQDSAATL